MTPLGGVVAGLLLVVLDLRISGFDLLLDPLGWLLAVGSLGRLVPLEGTFARARWAAVLAGVLSVADVARPVVDGKDARPEGLHGLLTDAYGLAVGLMLVLLALALRNRAEAEHEPASARRFHGFAMLLGTFAVVSYALAAVVTLADDPLLPGVALFVVAMADLVAAIWFVVVVARHRRLPWLQDSVAQPSGAGR